MLVRERWRGLLRLPRAAPAAVGSTTGAVWAATGHHVEAAASGHRVAPVGRAVGRRTTRVRLPFVRVRLPCLGKKRLFYKGAEWRRGLVSDKMGQGSFMKGTTCGVKGAIFDVKHKNKVSTVVNEYLELIFSSPAQGNYQIAVSNHQGHPVAHSPNWF